MRAGGPCRLAASLRRVVEQCGSCTLRPLDQAGLVALGCIGARATEVVARAEEEGNAGGEKAAVAQMV